MLRFVVRRLLLLVPILVGLSILVFVWIRALPGRARAGAPRRAGDPAGGRAGPAPVRARQARSTCSTGATSTRPSHGDLGTSIVIAPAGDRRAQSSASRRRSSSPRGDVLRDHARHPARLPRRQAVRTGVRPREPRRLAGRRLDPDLLPALAAQVHLRGAAAAGCRASAARTCCIDTPHPTNFYVLDGIVTGDWAPSWDALKHLILPAIALGSIPLAIVARITRAAVLDVLNEDYVRTAAPRDSHRAIVDSRHVLRNAMLPVSTIIGLQTGLLLSGAVLTETVFASRAWASWLATRSSTATTR